MSSRALSRSFRTTALLFRKQLWLWPLIAMAILIVVGIWVRAYVEKPLKANLENGLTTILDLEVAALELWLDHQVERVELLAGGRALRAATVSLVSRAASAPEDVAGLLGAPEQEILRARYGDHHNTDGYNGYVLFNGAGLILSSDLPVLIGKRRLPEESPWLAEALAGKTVLTNPFKSRIVLPDKDGVERADVPTIMVLAPVRDEAGAQLGVLGVRVRPEAGFTQILQIAQMGGSGETYALNRDGLLLSQSRFDEDLVAMGLLADDGRSRSILSVEIRDPGVNMMAGERPEMRRSEQPLTLLAAELSAGRSGINVEGYRDYRGVLVVGAWKWLDRYDFGVATEVDVAQAYRPIYLLRTVFWGLYVLLALSAVAIFVFTVIVSRLNREARRAALNARKMGQYSLEEELGKGGMGAVYRAHHELLRRPTAIKLLDVERTTADSIARFEREVQLTSQLCHPNTITVFDYGRTPEGVFYYAMELLEGLDLDRLVIQYGPLPEGRVIHLLRQICGSLAEAHAAGLIHRDIKPANIMLTARAGIYDLIKVLDFGVVKAMDTTRQANLTAANSWVGTPYYMAPEAIQKPDSVDGRSDLYAVGAVGYYLLTGTMVFPGSNPAEVMHKHTVEPVEPMANRIGRPVTPALESLIASCLAKSPRQRPQSALALGERLAACECRDPWGQREAEAWWREHYPALAGGSVGEKKGSGDTPTVVLKPSED